MIVLSLVFLLGASAAGSAEPTTAADQKVKCRVEDVTGSLAGHKRVCHTVAEWRALDDAGNKSGRDIIERGEHTCGDCKPGG